MFSQEKVFEFMMRFIRGALLAAVSLSEGLKEIGRGGFSCFDLQGRRLSGTPGKVLYIRGRAESIG